MTDFGSALRLEFFLAPLRENQLIVSRKEDLRPQRKLRTV
ncbi:MAG: hypothetical protein QOH41_4399 [Blastocatellia bacterium]|jgi:hypothetical protein|nr:hypothetical protein [Blastocatellia bacterium]